LPTKPSRKATSGRKPKIRRKLARFGEFVQSARERCAASQQQALELLIRAGLKMSQSWVAQIETGRIMDPDAATLGKLAQAYGLDRDELVYALIRDKYQLDDLSVVSPLSRERWRACADLLRDFPAIGKVEGLEIDQLRGKSQMLQLEILDLEGLARWQREFPKLKELWIVSPHFQDDKDPGLREAVVHNLGRGVRHFYFVPKIDLEEGRPFWLFLRRLAQDHPPLRNRLQKQVHGVGLDEAELRWIATDLIIANPTDPASRTAFVGLRHDRALKFACRMSDLDAESAVHGIMPFLTKRLKRPTQNS
jgi:transcriptional regulator with XRE-family HTH domain